MNSIFRIAFDGPATEWGCSRAISFKKFRCLIYVEFCKAGFEDRVRHVSRIPKFGNHIQERLRRFRGALIAEPRSRRTFENRDCVDCLMQPVNHSVRAKLVGGNLLQSDTYLTQYVRSCVARHIQGMSSTTFCFRLNLVNRASQLKMGSIHKSRDGLCSPLQCSKICFIHQLGRSTVLTGHDKNCHDQCSDRADCLNPTRPSVPRKSHLVANYRNSHRSSDQGDSKKYIGFLHESTQSCLKGILA